MSAGRPQKPLTHGTEYAYSHRSCRCDECRTAAVAADRRRRHARKARQEQGQSEGMAAYQARDKRYAYSPNRDDFAMGFQRSCACGHAPGMHALVKLGQPQPCEASRCRCRNLTLPTPEHRVTIHDFPVPIQESVKRAVRLG